MDCATFQDRLQLVMIGEAEPAGRAELADHALACASCRAELERWEEAQRAIEASLARGTSDGREPRRLAEEVYAGAFGSAVELDAPASLPAAPPRGFPGLLVGLALGLILGYLAWGTARGGSSQLAQLYYQQMLLTGQFSGVQPGWTGGPAMGPPMAGSNAGEVARDLFGLFLIIWVTRAELWRLIFPGSIPRGIHIARWLALPLAIVGTARVVGGLVLSVASVGRWTNPLVTQELQALSTVFVFIDSCWNFGFWLVLLVVLFSVGDRMLRRYLQPKTPAGGA